MKYIVFLALALTLGCAKAPANLTPEASIAFKDAQVVKALDVLRDSAVAANAQRPSLLSEASTRKVVTYHEAIVKTVKLTPAGWKPAAAAGLDELLKALSPADKALLGPYLSLVKAILKEVK